MMMRSSTCSLLLLLPAACRLMRVWGQTHESFLVEGPGARSPIGSHQHAPGVSHDHQHHLRHLQSTATDTEWENEFEEDGEPDLRPVSELLNDDDEDPTLLPIWEEVFGEGGDLATDEDQQNDDAGDGEPDLRPISDLLTSEEPSPVPTTYAPSPEPTTAAPLPVPTTNAPSPAPTTYAPSVVEITSAPVPAGEEIVSEGDDMTAMGVYPCPSVPGESGFLDWGDLVAAIEDESAGQRNIIFLLCPTVFIAKKPLFIRDSNIEIGCVTMYGCVIQNATVAIADGVEDVVLAGLEFVDQSGEITVGWETHARFIACTFHDTLFPGTGVQRAAVVSAGYTLFLFCNFAGNIGQGAVFVAGGAPFFEGCQFASNRASEGMVTAAAILVCAIDGTTAQVSMRNSCFDDNMGSFIVYVYNVPYSQVVLNLDNAVTNLHGGAQCAGVATFYNESLTTCDEFDFLGTTCEAHIPIVTRAPIRSPTIAPSPGGSLAIDSEHSSTPSPTPAGTLAIDNEHSSTPSSSPTPFETWQIDTVIDDAPDEDTRDRGTELQRQRGTEPQRGFARSRKDPQPPADDGTGESPLSAELQRYSFDDDRIKLSGYSGDVTTRSTSWRVIVAMIVIGVWI